tara:strand:+ start:171 stop:302 length:132 start_codon:yes stop_codon:yes gene_type:complete
MAQENDFIFKIVFFIKEGITGISHSFFSAVFISLFFLNELIVF